MKTQSLFSLNSDEHCWRGFTDMDIYFYVNYWLFKNRLRQIAGVDDPLVMFQFFNRSGLPLREIIPYGLLCEELEYASSVRFTESDAERMKNVSTYGYEIGRPALIESMRQVRLPKFNIGLLDKDYDITYTGRISDAIWGEMPVITTMTEMFLMNEAHRLRISESGLMLAAEREIDRAIGEFSKHRGLSAITLFGMRRRASYEMELMAEKKYHEALPWLFTGGSNILATQMLDPNLPLRGTLPHLAFLIVAGLMFNKSDEEMRAGQLRLFEEVIDFFGGKIQLLIPDTFGSASTFELLTEKLARAYRSHKQDSGVPEEYVAAAHEFLARFGIGPEGYKIVHSDNLNDKRVIELDASTRSMGFEPSYGVGGFTTFNFGGLIKRPDFVVKPVAVKAHEDDEWMPIWKIGDGKDRYKVCGRFPGFERYERAFPKWAEAQRAKRGL